MNMGLYDKSKKSKVPLWKSFHFAIEGINHALRNERNIRIHLFISVLVILGSIYFSITIVEWILVLFAIGGMLALELINTAIERIVDLVTADIHPLAKQAKDLAASAVFLYATFSIVIGFIIFLPRVWRLFF
ncbi:MAG: diacylglycerol kinase family protein [Bacillota bacterium]|nr:diacylglycerol kinase family protein [Bacillota bacterium]